MQKYNYILNSGLWGYEPFEKVMSPVWGHKYHILPTNVAPLAISFAIFTLVLVVVSNLHLHLHSVFMNKVLSIFELFHIYEIANCFDEFKNFNELYILWFAPFILSLGVFFLWSANAIEEGSNHKLNVFGISFQNITPLASKTFISALFHSNLVRKGFKIGFILFIASEVMFFFGFFWAFFHSSLSPSIQIGAVWPPIGVDFITVKGFAVANTIILLTSGASLTIAHYSLELIPQWRINIYKHNHLWNENLPFYREDDKYKTKKEKAWDPSFDQSKIKSGSFFDENGRLRFSYPEQFNNPYDPIETFGSLLEINDETFKYSESLKDTETITRVYINFMLNLTVMLAILFMFFQTVEYFISPVNINTGVYGSTFYMITGLHGFHVFIGTCFLIYCRIAVSMSRVGTRFVYMLEWFVRKASYLGLHKYPDLKNPTLLAQFNSYDMWLYGRYGIESFECAAWYWHFVDVVWIFVFAFVYIWSHLTVLNNG